MAKKRTKAVIVIDSIAIALVAAMLGIVVYAVLKQSDDDVVTNRFYPADVNIAVQENSGDNSEETPEFTNEITWTPDGDTYKAIKQVCVKNPDSSGDNNTDAYIRVCLIPRWQVQVKIATGTTGVAATADYSGYTLGSFPPAIDGTGYTMGVSAAAGTDTINRTVTFTLASNWADNWIYKDGYFYCKSVIAPGEETPLLLESVSVDKSFFAEFATKNGCNFQVDVIADSIQADGGAVDVRWAENGVTIDKQEIATATRTTS